MIPCWRSYFPFRLNWLLKWSSTRRTKGHPVSHAALLITSNLFASDWNLKKRSIVFIKRLSNPNWSESCHSNSSEKRVRGYVQHWSAKPHPCVLSSCNQQCSNLWEKCSWQNVPGLDRFSRTEEKYRWAYRQSSSFLSYCFSHQVWRFFARSSPLFFALSPLGHVDLLMPVSFNTIEWF